MINERKKVDHNEINDWKKIAHDEFENRKRIELKLARTIAMQEENKQAKHAIDNYNLMLSKQFKALEIQHAEQKLTLQRTIDMLKKAQQLIVQRKQELATLSAENIDLKNKLTEKTTLIETMMLDHENTNRKLALTMNKLANAQAAINTTTTAIADTPPAQISIDDIIYLEADINNQQLDEFFQQMVITSN